MNKVLAWPASRLAVALARELSCECSEIAMHRFPDGERLVRIDTDVTGRAPYLPYMRQDLRFQPCRRAR